MLTLSASFQKKIPVPGQEYSSQSFHAEIQCELPDGLNSQQLQDRIHSTFMLVRDSVENELQQNGNGKTNGQSNVNGNGYANGNGQQIANGGNGHSNGQNGNGNKPVQKATEKQINYLLILSRQAKTSISEMLGEFGKSSATDLSSEECSKLIERLRGMTAGRA